MARYAIIEDGRCTNVIEADAEFAEEIGAVAAPEDCGIGDGYAGGIWTKAPRPEPEPWPEDDPEYISDADALRMLFGGGDNA